MDLNQFAAQYDEAVRGIAKIIKGTSIFMNLLPVEQVQGLSHKIGSLVYEGGISTRKLNAAFPAVGGSVVSPGTERIIIAGSPAKTDVRLAQSRPDEIARRTRALSRFIDAQILRGEGAADQERLVGLNSILAGDQLIDNAADGAPLDMDRFHDLLDAVEDQGAGRFVVMNRNCARQLKGLLMEAAGGATVADLSGVVGEYEGVKLYVAGKDHDGDELLPFSETMGQSNATSSAYCIAPGVDGEEKTGCRILMATDGLTTYSEGIRDSQHIDVVEVAFGRAIYHPKAAARLRGITSTVGA